ncbi:MAG: CaiB/BaiF CoA transferase family protein [Rhodospirillaceae bacterium]
MKPLHDVRVVDLSRVLAGPWSSQILADLGADVIKVERRGEGDDTRAWGPPFVPAAGGENLDATYFHSTNRGKRSVAVDFNSADDRELVLSLIAEADIVIENFKVGALKKYGLDYASLSASHPGLIYCSITGFGQTGPYAHRPGYDAMIQALGGMMSITGEANGEPMKVGVAVVDLFTGVYATTGILAALHQRQATGRGAHIDMSLLDVQVGVLANQAASYLISGQAAPRLGNAHPNLAPYQVFAVADGHLMIAVGNDGQFVRLCEVLGVQHLAADALYRTNPDRVRNRQRLIPLLSEQIARWKKSDLFARLEAANVPAGPINTVPEVFADPHVIARGMRVDIDSPAAAGGRVPAVRTPIMIDGEPCVSERPAPRLGEHTDEIKQSLEAPADLSVERKRARLRFSAGG